jgi:hypothetical protein
MEILLKWKMVAKITGTSFRKKIVPSLLLSKRLHPRNTAFFSFAKD